MAEGNKKRKPRNKKAKEIKNLLIPVKLEDLGTPQDPCFGKLFDPKAAECNRCGDAELCQIALARIQLPKERSKVEEAGKFRDLEEKGIYGEATLKDIKKDIRTSIKKHKKIEMKVLAESIAYKYPTQMTSDKVIKLIQKMAKKTDKFVIKNLNLIWA